MFIVGAQRDAVLRLFMRYDVYRSSYMDDYRISLLSSRSHGSNDTYLLQVDNKQFVMRVVDPSAPAIDRSVEQCNHQLMADAGLTWPFLLFDVSNGVKISEFFDGCMLESADMQNPVLLDRLMHCLSQLHHSDCLLRQGHSPLHAYQHIADSCSTLECSVVLEGDRLVRALANMGTSYQPCHQDTVLKNFVLVQDRVLLIDWEHAAMGDPYYDFADFVNQNYGDCGDDVMAYCARFLGGENHFNVHKFRCYYYLSMLTWGLWFCRKGQITRGHALLQKLLNRHFDARRCA